MAYYNGWLRKSGRYDKKYHVNWNILLFKTHKIYETYKIISHHHRMSLKIKILYFYCTHKQTHDNNNYYNMYAQNKKYTYINFFFSLICLNGK